MNTTTKLLLFTLFFLYGQVFAQYTQSIDISTGIDDFSQLIPLNSPDDDWTVQVPNSTLFVPAKCGSGDLSPGGPSNNAIPYTSINTTIRFISPFMNTLGQHGTGPEGFYYYRMYFEVTSCNITSIDLNFEHIMADNLIDQVSINNNAPHSVNYGFIQATTQATIALSPSELVSGQNFITVRCYNEGSWTGIQIKGNIKIHSNNLLDCKLSDKNGVEKTEFCIEEDVFLKETGSNFYTFKSLEISEMNGNTPVWTLPYGIFVGGPVVGNNIGIINSWYPFEVNLTKLFENNVPTPVVFQPGKTYRVKFKEPSSCQLEVTKYFTYKCCTSSTDASFWAKISNGQLSVSGPTIKGTHEWKVYSIANGINGQYTHLGTYSTPTFSLNLANPNLCYYVTHSIKTPCGDACASQIICGAECGDKECNLTPPTGLTVSRVGNQDFLSWNPVPGAFPYTVEITPNDPRCCGSAGGGLDGSISAPLVFSNIFGTSHTVDNHTFEAGPGDVDLTCYSWRVIAKCPDGGTVSSSSTCSNGSAPGGSGTSIDKSNPGSVGELSPEESSRLTIYPNPTNGMISFEVKTEKEDVYTVTITDLAGKKIESFEQMKTNKKQLRITWDTSSLVAGEYLVTLVNSANEIMVKKFIKE